METFYTEKIQKADNAHCPNCGANFVYDPKHFALFCSNCKTVHPIEKLPCDKKIDYYENIKTQNTTEYQKWVDDNKIIKCKSCGANVLLNKYEYSKKCPYCDSSYVVKTSQIPTMPPQGIIPFCFSKEEASNLYKINLRKKWFLPNTFKKAIPISNIKGIYIPTYSFDANSDSKYDGKLERKKDVTKDGKTETISEFFNIDGTAYVTHKNAIVETSSLIKQYQLDSLKPFNLSRLVKFKQEFIMGYCVEQPETLASECKKIADKIFESEIRQVILRRYDYDYVNYLNIKTQFSSVKYAYYILPIYKNEFLYKNKSYITFMNGQNGKICGNVPRSGLKITFFVLLMIAIFIILPLLFFLGISNTGIIFNK